MDYRAVYLSAQCIIGIMFLTLYYLYRVNQKGQRPGKLDALFFLFMLTLVLDCIWILIDGRPELRTQSIVLELVYLSAMSFTGYTWFLHTLDLFPAKSMKIRRYKYILGIPVLVSLGMIFMSPSTNWVFEIDDSGTYIRGNWSLFPIILNYLYMILGSYIALRCRREALLTIEKNRYGIAALFPVPVLLLSGVQVILPPGLPTMQGGVLIAMLLLYGNSQNERITTDHLTGLPNRVAFEMDLMDRIQRYKQNDNNHLYLMEGDLDKFKQINDTYGHVAGDEALLLTANVMKQFFYPYNAAVFRTGGDEFLISCETEKPIDIEEIRKSMNKALAESMDSARGMDLSMSIGIAEYSEDSNFRSLLEEVDKSLYEAKRVASQS